MQTILGSGGAIGTPLAKELLRYTDEIRLVSRHPRKVNETDALFAADITDPIQVDKAIEGSDIVYLTVGFAYDIKVWRREWPKLIRNVLDSCRKYNSRLVFFDNVYALDRDFMHHLTEDTPIRPTSRKGQVRAEVHRLIMEEIEGGRVEAIIARCADFYGLKNSVLVEMVYNNLLHNKKAMWFSNAGKIHTFTAASDAAKGVAVLGNTPDAFNQIWHLPTDQSPLTGKQWVDLFARLMNTEARLFVIPTPMLSLMGLFNPLFRELKEMNYQYERDYIFSSAKFEKRFNYTPLKPEEGIAKLIAELTPMEID
jgi:nucleoside-diphosphate-sugar epimerase